MLQDNVIHILSYLIILLYLIRIGKKLSTKGPDSDDRLDVTNIYKFKEGIHIYNYYMCIIIFYPENKSAGSTYLDFYNSKNSNILQE